MKELTQFRQVKFPHLEMRLWVLTEEIHCLQVPWMARVSPPRLGRAVNRRRDECAGLQDRAPTPAIALNQLLLNFWDNLKIFEMITLWGDTEAVIPGGRDHVLFLLGLTCPPSSHQNGRAFWWGFSSFSSLFLRLALGDHLAFILFPHIAFPLTRWDERFSAWNFQGLLLISLQPHSHCLWMLLLLPLVLPDPRTCQCLI